jgi:branched-chain amino acid transport system permease protein
VLDLLPHLVNGLVLGLLFALIALGFMLIVGLMEQINLAHGSLFALGAYMGLQFIGRNPPLPADLTTCWLQLPLGWRYALALVIAPCLVGVVGIAVEVCMRRTYGKDPLYGLLLTFGAAMVIEEGIRLIWGTRDYVLEVAAGSERRIFVPGPDLVDLPLLRRRHRRGGDWPRLAHDRKNLLWRDHQGRRP